MEYLPLQYLSLYYAVDESGVDFATLSQYGVLGIFAILMIAFIKTMYKRETDRADRLEQENRDLHEHIRERVVPALISVTATMEDASDLLVEMHAIVRDLRELPPIRRPRRTSTEGDS
jgi:hypothetical protein